MEDEEWEVSDARAIIFHPLILPSMSQARPACAERATEPKTAELASAILLIG